MKIVICGDTHIGAVYGLGSQNLNGLNTRIYDYEKTLLNIVDHCINNEVDVFIQTGDLFDKRTPTPEQMEIANSAFKKLSANGIFCAVIMGNHDYKKNGPTYTSSILGLSAKDLPNVRMVIQPELITITNKSDKANLILLPFRDRKLFTGKNCREDSLQYEQEVADLLQKADDAPTIAVGHNFFYEGSYSEYGGSEVLPKIEAFSECDFVAMGHYHNFKILKKKDPIAIYTGSMERINFGDAESKKIFIEYETIEKKVRVITSPVRDLSDLTISLEDSSFETIEADIEESLSRLDIKDKIVRLKIILHEKTSTMLKANSIEKRLYELGAYFVSKINFEHIYQKIVRDTSILDEKDNYSIFKAFVLSQGFEEDMKEKILLEARSIME